VTSQRVSRGRKTQELAAERFRSEGWSDAWSRPASLPGVDIPGLSGLAPEVKATEGQDFTGALRQAKKNAGSDLPFVIYRPRGYGEERINDWVVALRFEDMIKLLKKAGYQ
jgi:hypothetical protein